MTRPPFNPTIPARLKNSLSPFTPYPSGWCRWYGRKMVHVCGKKTPLDEIENRWIAAKAKIDNEAAGQPVPSSAPTVLDGASRFFEWLEQRVLTGKPKRLSPYTAKDYRREINQFGAHVGPHKPLADLLDDPEPFTSYARLYNDNAPDTLRRVVAYVQAFFSFLKDEGVIPAVPRYGRYFVKPPMEDRRDKRMSETKSFTSAELRDLVAHATVEERAWIGLGLTGALDNADLANLTHDVIDQKKKLIDYRRRKQGKVRRIIPVHPTAWKWLQAYQRPTPADPAYAALVFLTPTGLPLQRILNDSPIDYVAMQFNRLMIRAGLKPPLPKRSRRKDQPESPRKVKAKGSAAGRGFRSLRTTFPNLAPPGFRDEVEIIMGHREGTMLVENYLERYGVDRLRELVTSIWNAALASPPPKDGLGRKRKGKSAEPRESAPRRRAARRLEVLQPV